MRPIPRAEELVRQADAVLGPRTRITEPAVPAPATILDELEPYGQFVIWRYEERGGKRTKVPYDAKAPGRRASATDRSTWALLDMALAAVVSADGIGFVLTEDDPYSVVDLDHVRDPQSGEIAPAARAVIDALDGYAELSPSGTGVHIWVVGRPPGTRARKAGIECYWSQRYITLTGVTLDGEMTWAS